jgi:hypothetical protein
MRILPFATVLVLAVPVYASQAPQRQSDADVKALIEDVNQARDRFEDALDGKIKNGIVRGPSGETKVEAFLQDLQDNVNKLKERFTDRYAASAEAQTVLRQGSTVAAFMRGQPADIKGRSEWDRMAMELGRLAHAYGTSFPLGDGAVRRINDGEVATTAEAIAKQADKIKQAVGRDKAIVKADRDKLNESIETLKRLAETVKDRASGSRPATAEFAQLKTAVAGLDAAFKARQLAPAVLTEWGALRAPLETLNQAYGIKP